MEFDRLLGYVTPRAQSASALTLETNQKRMGPDWISGDVLARVAAAKTVPRLIVVRP